MSWFRIERVEDVVHAWILDDIGADGVDAKNFEEELGDARTVEVTINSSGGIARVGLDVGNVLLSRDTTCVVSERCFSAAVPILLGGRIRRAFEGASIMVHRTIASTVGDVTDHKEAARGLWSLHVALVKLFGDRTRQTHDVISGWLAEGDRYFSPGEALGFGLVDEILPRPPPPIPVMVPGTGAHIAPPGFSESETLLLHVLRALGPVDTADPRRIRREIAVWLNSNLRAVSPSTGSEDGGGDG
ncbi:MAG: ATP-dependent Clp protease proteolytic subunit [Limisphaerales bacterium]